MEYNRLGRSTMSVSKICLGTMHFGPKADEAESHKILDRAVEMGIKFIDTANVYGAGGRAGRSEEIIGSWFAARPGIRDEVVLATKVYHPMGDLGLANGARGFSAYKVRQHLAASLRRLQTDRIDLYQVHHIDERVSGRSSGEPTNASWPTATCSMPVRATTPAGGWRSARCRRGSAASSASSPSRPSTTCSAGCPRWRCCPRPRTSASAVMVYMPLAGGLLTGKAASIDGSRTAAGRGGVRNQGREREPAVRRLLRAVPRDRRDRSGRGDGLGPAAPGRGLRHRRRPHGRAARRSGPGRRPAARRRRR